MKASRVVLALLLALVVGGAAAVVWFMRSPAAPAAGAGSEAGQASGASAAPRADAADALPKTSEELIAEALAARDITYEESLLGRAYALFDDPRLQASFRSPVPNWEASTALLIEIARNEAKLSKELVKDLEPFRVRPSHPNSIFNRPRADVLKAQHSREAGWEHDKVEGIPVRLWIKGPAASLVPYKELMIKAWNTMPNFFPHPKPDDGTADKAFNPDNLIDAYLVHANDIDPRMEACRDPSSEAFKNGQCTAGDDNGGLANHDGPIAGTTASGYVLINIDIPPGDRMNRMIGTMAHELSHVTQFKYDFTEHERLDSKWISEGSATWVAYKVLKKLEKRPARAYELLDGTNGVLVGTFKTFETTLRHPLTRYNTWLFFYYASMTLRDGVVTRIWEKAQFEDGMKAVDMVVPLKEHLPRYMVRNWNQDPVPNQYKTKDGTFDPSLKPDPIFLVDQPPRIRELNDAGRAERMLSPLTAKYWHFKFPEAIRKVTFQNLYRKFDYAHVWAIKRVGADWWPPEDWSQDVQREFCRDIGVENVTELVLIVTNTDRLQWLPPMGSGAPPPRVLSEENGCPIVEGYAQATERRKDDSQDVTYKSDRVRVQFRPRAVQDQPGNVQYDMLPALVTWTATGRKHDCTISGNVTVQIGGTYSAANAVAPYGYLNVVGEDGNDFHSVMILGGVPNGAFKKTCPGPPPVVTNDPHLPPGLLHILKEKNATAQGTALYKGHQTLDFAEPFTGLPGNPVETLNPQQMREMTQRAIEIARRGGGPGALEGVNMAEVEKALRELERVNMAEVKRKLKETPKGQMVFTFDWELKPKSGGLRPGPSSSRPPQPTP